MGLDMYLFQRGGTVNVDTGETSQDIELGYWRKFNALHGFIWQLKQDEYDDDNATDMMLTKDDIETILTVLRDVYQVLEEGCSYSIDDYGEERFIFSAEAQDKAAGLLPPYPGFFFGTYDIDEWYYQDVKNSITIFEHALELVEQGEEIYYHAWY